MDVALPLLPLLLLLVVVVVVVMVEAVVGHAVVVTLDFKRNSS